MKVLSLFSGVGGFDLGLERAGMETVFQCEWDKHATSVLERHWPDVPRWGDITTLTGQHILNHAPVIDVVAWGSPCQDLSVAGKRAGLGGSRSGLFHEGIRIIKELRELTNGKYPRISIWENVYGALNSNKGADFGVILDEMAEAGALVQEWRVLDAQYFGVPQRRRRVFLVSVFDSGTAERCPDPLLPVSESVRRDIEAGGTARETAAGATQESFGNGGFQRWTETDTAITLSARDHKSSNTMVVGSLAARDYKGVGNQYVQEGKLVVEPFVKSKRAQSATDDETWVEGAVNPTINQFDQGDVRATTVVVGSLQARDHKGTNHEGARDGKLILEPILIDGRRVDDVRVYNPPVQTLQERMGTGGNNVPVIGFPHTQGLSAQPSESAWPTLRTEGAGMAVAFTTEQTPKYNIEQALTITKQSPSGGGQPQAVMESTMSVRRLTPLECERLMGWPDGWTAGQADTHRYKQCGNGVASPVATWIAQQLMAIPEGDA